jgi:nucleoid-associated protein YgaU
LTGIVLLLIALGVLLREKFAEQDQRLLRFDHLTMKSLVLGQNPEAVGGAGSEAKPSSSAAAAPTAATPAWATLPDQRDASRSSAKQNSSSGTIELAAHFTDEAREAETPTRAEQFPVSTPSTRPSSAMPQQDRTLAETPRTLFNGPDEENHRAEQARPALLPQTEGAAAVPAAADPFAQIQAVAPVPHAANGSRERAGTRAPANEDVSLPGSFELPISPQSSRVEQAPGSGEEGRFQRYQHAREERGSSVPPMTIQQVAGAESAVHRGMPEPQPLELTPTPARLPAQHAMPGIPAQPSEIPSLPSEIPSLDSPAEKPHQARPLMPVSPSAVAPVQREPSQLFPADSAPTRAAPQTNQFQPSLQAVASQTTSKPEPAAKTKEEVHQVQPGDNYWTISRKYYGTARFFSALGEYNKHRIPQPEKMKPGMYVLVPDVEVLHQRYPQLTGGGGETEPAPPGYFVDPSGQPCYRVGKGDTLTEIAEQHLGRSSRWVQVYGMNKDRIPNVNSLKIGAVLRLPADATQVVLAPGSSELR